MKIKAEIKIDVVTDNDSRKATAHVLCIGHFHNSTVSTKTIKRVMKYEMLNYIKSTIK